ncbi:MAG: 3-deoxy-7-phosphoheptulonate synthase, partial [Cyanobacteria bacterium P01_D01_bin.36]
SVAACEAALIKAGHEPNVMIDCSHGNSRKDWRKQLEVLKAVSQQIQTGSQSIIGVMLESNLQEGNQPIPDDPEEIRPGVSITDACVGWDMTETALRELAAVVGPALKSRAN